MKKLERLDPESLAHNPRASLSSWYRYQDVVVAAYRTAPLPYIYPPSGMTASTVVSRIRDAIRGCLCFRYPISDPSITHEALEAWYATIIIKQVKSDVVICAPKMPDVEALRPSKPIEGLAFDTLTFEEVAAFHTLIASGRIRGPITITNPPDVSLIPEHPNVNRIDQNGALVLL